MKLIDTHSHINFNQFKEDGGEVIQRALKKDVEMIIVGAEYKTSRRAIEYANKYEKGVYSAVGLHPLHLQKITAQEEEENISFDTRGEEFHYDIYEKLAKSDEVVAIGEVGLDYYHINLAENLNEIKKRQQEVLVKQLLLARELDLPVIIHCRMAHLDLLSLLKDFKKKYARYLPNDRPWGVIHCFSGDEDLAWRYFNLGLMISFTGLITFSKQWDDLIRKMPSDRFMIETDCPFMAPEPYRGKRNEPLLVKYVAQRIAEIRSTELEKIADISTKNAQAFFEI
ncbi:MAG: TatD family hydrolase [Candidatus Moraniibacteriota bacterium]